MSESYESHVILAENTPDGIRHRKLPALWQHQREAIARAGNKFALFFDPGCGKSRTAIELLRRASKTPVPYSRREDNFRRVLILAPLNVCRNWENEFAQYFGDPFEIFLVSGQTKPKKLKILEQYRQSAKAMHKVLICNIECMRGDDYRAVIGKCGIDFIIVDESHNFKTFNAQQTRGLIDLTQRLKPQYLYLLTGTPAPQGEIDLWSTFYLLGKTTDSFFLWRKKHFDDKNERRRGHPSYFPDYKIRESSRVKLQAALAECSAVARKSEVLDLPELLRTNIYAEMSPTQARHYESMKEFLFAIDAEGNELNAANFLSRSMRLQQILAGFLGEVAIEANPRLKALEAAIEKTNEALHPYYIGRTNSGGIGLMEPEIKGVPAAQFIIWTIFKSTYNQIGELLTKLGIRYGMLTGQESPEDRHANMNAFQAGELRALIAHPRAGGVGVNLTAASYSIHYTKNFNLVDDLQCEARNYRGGSERHQRITRIDIITPNTIDEEITTALREKKSVQEFILGLKHRRGAASGAEASDD